MKEVAFNAPWAAPLTVMTTACCVICLGIPGAGVIIVLGGKIAWLPDLPPWVGWVFCVLPILTMAGTALFMVRGYVLTSEALLIRRLIWTNRFELSQFLSATVDANAVNGAIRIFGNGGFFAFTGMYRNSQLGIFRAYATDTKRAVVLRFSGKTLVITPDDPPKFVREIDSRKSLPAS